jgi:hypothetical protein
MAVNPQTSQGNLNRVRSSVIIPAFPTLNVNSSHMGKGFLDLVWDEAFGDQIETGTGVVNSPAPYVKGTCTINLLRSQALSASWQSQVDATSIIGRIVVHPDSTVYPAQTLHDCQILHASPGRMDGLNPTIDVVISGVRYVNNSLWNMV